MAYDWGQSGQITTNGPICRRTWKTLLHLLMSQYLRPASGNPIGEALIMSRPSKVRQSHDIEHMKWLVAARSRNQISSLEISIIIKDNYEIISNDHILKDTSQGLVGVSFSLWRAVFLSDVSDELGDLLIDAEVFIDNLVLNNMVAYPQDRNAREWSFMYYMNNAKHRLERMVNDKRFSLLTLEEYGPSERRSAAIAHPRSWWNYNQDALDTAVRKFSKILTEKPANIVPLDACASINAVAKPGAVGNETSN